MATAPTARTKTGKTTKKARRVANPRKPIDPHSPVLADRFALRIRALMEARGLKPPDVIEQLKPHGVDIAITTFFGWMNGSRLPTMEYTEALAKVLLEPGEDWRMIFPPPSKRSRKTS